MKVIDKSDRFIREGSLSWDAVGVMAYIIDKYGEDGRFVLKDFLVKFEDSNNTTLNALNELVGLGFLEAEDQKIKRFFEEEFWLLDGWSKNE